MTTTSRQVTEYSDLTIQFRAARDGFGRKATEERRAEYVEDVRKALEAAFPGAIITATLYDGVVSWPYTARRLLAMEEDLEARAKIAKILGDVWRSKGGGDYWTCWNEPAPAANRAPRRRR